MNDEKRAWTAEEILDALWYSAESASHKQTALATYLASCTRLLATARELVSDHEYCKARDCDLIDDLRKAIDEEGDK